MCIEGKYIRSPEMYSRSRFFSHTRPIIHWVCLICTTSFRTLLFNAKTHPSEKSSLAPSRPTKEFEHILHHSVPMKEIFLARLTIFLTISQPLKLHSVWGSIPLKKRKLQRQILATFQLNHFQTNYREKEPKKTTYCQKPQKDDRV